MQTAGRRQDNRRSRAADWVFQGIRPKDWAEMTTPERMFCCAVIEMEIAAEEKR